MLFPPSLTIYLPSAILTFALCLVLCCAGTVSVCSFDIHLYTKTIMLESQLYIKRASHKAQLKYHARAQSMTQLSIIYYYTMVLGQNKVT